MARTSTGTEIVAGVDLGSTTVSTVILEVDGAGGRSIVGVASVPSGGGIREGQVVSIERATEAIRASVAEAARMADCEITNVRLGIGGSDALGINSDGTVAVRGGRVTPQDIERVLEAARAMPLPMEKQILHALPQEFIVDGHDRIRSPVGMNGVRLETRVHVITAARTPLVNAIECCTKAGLTVDQVVFAGLASAAAVTTREERELGCAVVDVGGGTTDLTVWYDHALVHSVSWDWGGEELTKQIARGLRTPVREAEGIKRQYGCALASLIADGETMAVQSVGHREVQVRQRHVLCEIIEPMLEEMFARVDHELNVAGCRELLAAGVVLTGGTAKLEAIADLGEEILVGLPVRVGVPQGLRGLSEVVEDPTYATAAGLGLDTFDTVTEPVGPNRQTRSSGLWSRFRDAMDRWF